jgi:hypothetical protein
MPDVDSLARDLATLDGAVARRLAAIEARLAQDVERKAAEDGRALHARLDAIGRLVESEVAAAIGHVHALEDRLMAFIGGPRAVIAALVLGLALGGGLGAALAVHGAAPLAAMLAPLR